MGKWQKVKKSHGALAAGALVPDSSAEIVPRAPGLWLPFHPVEPLIPLTQLLPRGDHGQGSIALPGRSGLDVSYSGRSGDK